MMVRPRANVEALQLVPARCCICRTADAEPIAVGEDLEYRTSSDIFLAVQCRNCGLVYLDPRPTVAESRRIYPPSYNDPLRPTHHGIVDRIGPWNEARVLLSCCRRLPSDALIVDIGCGDGSRLKLLRKLGPPNWKLEGVDIDESATSVASSPGVGVRIGDAHHLNLPESSVDLALMIDLIEHLEDPAEAFRSVIRILKPGGHLLVLAENTDSLAFKAFRTRHWGGYNFPRHWYLFNPRTIGRLATQSGYDIDDIRTRTSPIAWICSLRSVLISIPLGKVLHYCQDCRTGDLCPAD
jgi:SAM-dependent methyltransferase